MISASFCTFVEVTQTLLGGEGKSGLTRWCKSTTHSVKDYYDRAQEFPEDKQVIVVSDVIDWCKKQPYLQGDRFHFSDASYEEFGDGASVPYIDLCLMTLCGGAIIANSSLSWWGAWLQGDTGKVVAPDPWFGPAYSHYNMKDMIPERWVKLHNDPRPVLLNDERFNIPITMSY